LNPSCQGAIYSIPLKRVQNCLFLVGFGTFGNSEPVSGS
jgi:hypothetical protein